MTVEGSLGKDSYITDDVEGDVKWQARAKDIHHICFPDNSYIQYPFSDWMAASSLGQGIHGNISNESTYHLYCSKFHAIQQVALSTLPWDLV